VAIIDCGVGNLYSIKNALQKTGLEANILSATQNLQNVDAIVLPGVGNFKAGAENLRSLKPRIVGLVDSGVPLFGVCLGMQLLFEGSEESSGEGLGLLKGQVQKLPANVKAPHMGWNTLTIMKKNELLDGVAEGDYFYFVHSYYANPADKKIAVANTSYGLDFASVVAKNNVLGTQFHPEKSGKPGERVLQNFSRIIKR
jgi:glutamine amidotransferase